MARFVKDSNAIIKTYRAGLGRRGERLGTGIMFGLPCVKPIPNALDAAVCAAVLY